MTLKGKQNHYNIKFLKGYGFSISVKDSKIILKNTSDPFKEPEIEKWYVNNMPYEKIVMSGKGYISTSCVRHDRAFQMACRLFCLQVGK